MGSDSIFILRSFRKSAGQLTQAFFQDTARTGDIEALETTACRPKDMAAVEPEICLMDNGLIEGHTDSVGGDASNRDLSLRRAEAVQQALTDRRIAAARIEVSGLGEGFPVASNNSAAGRQQNRRIEVIFSDDAGSIKARSN